MFKIIFLICFFLSSLFSQNITFLTHSTKDKVYIDESKEMRGLKHSGRRSFQVKLIREMMKLVAHKSKIIHDVPYKRGLLIVQREDNIAFFNMARRPHREDLVKWVGPLQVGESFFYTATKFPKIINSIEDSKKLKSICVLNGTSHDTFLVNNGFENIIRNNSYEGCFKMLVHGRVDVAMLSAISLHETLKAANISEDKVQKSFLAYSLDGYLAMSKNIDDSTIKTWQNALDKLKSDGTYDLLMLKYWQSK